MNYIKQLNAFYNHLEFNPLSNNAILLWHSLMQINNKTGWMHEFTVSAKVLTAKIQLNDSAFKRARNELKEKGYIQFQSRGGNQAPIYEMISLIIKDQMNTIPNTEEENIVVHNNQIPTGNTDRIVDHHMDPNMNHNGVHKPAPLYKQEVKTKQNKNKTITTTTNKALLFYVENIGNVSPFIEGQISDWSLTLGETLVIEAMKLAVESNHLYWNYVKSILKTWHRKGIATIEEVESDQKTFRKQQKAQNHAPKSSKQEVIPDWFHDRKKKQIVYAYKAKETVDIEKRLKDFVTSNQLVNG